MGKLVEEGYQTAGGFLTDNAEPPRVTHVLAGSAAADAGLKSGDVIVRVNGEVVRSAHDVETVMKANRPRDQKVELKLAVRRGGKDIELPAFRPRTLPVQPTQLYESISMALLLFLLLAFEPFARQDGMLMALMMIGYSIHRYFNEKLRSDERPESLEKYTSVLVLAGGVALLAWLLWKRPAPRAAPAAWAARPV